MAEQVFHSKFSVLTRIHGGTPGALSGKRGGGRRAAGGFAKAEGTRFSRFFSRQVSHDFCLS
jgi:hypothetical protein